MELNGSLQPEMNLTFGKRSRTGCTRVSGLGHAALRLFCAIGAAASLLEGAENPPGGLLWQQAITGRSAPVSSHSGRTLLELLAPGTTRIHFTNALAEDRHLTNQILLNGSGVAAGDIDGDGWCDLYFCQLDGPNVLYRNLGNWTFADVTDEAGVRCPGVDATGTAFADLEGDGDLDLVVNSVASGTFLFLNDGRGRFTAVGTRINERRCGTSLALADIDGDGDLDMYVANYRPVTIRDQPNTRFSLRTIDGRPQVVSVDDVPITHPDLADRFNFRISPGEGGGKFAYDENGEPHLLLRNDGGGRFAAVPLGAGMFSDEKGQPLTKAPLDWGLSVMFRDLNGDGAPDLYVCNDFRSPDRIWINDGRGHFRAADMRAIRHTSLSSMGVDFADLNRDGFDDFIVVDMLGANHLRRFTQRIDIKPEALQPGMIENRPQYPHNTLFVNRGDGTWAECAQFSGLEAADWAWAPVFVDVDLDGLEDLLVSNGFERDGMNVDVLRQIEARKKNKSLSNLDQLRLRRMFPRLDTPNLAFRNRGGLKFEDVSEGWGFNLRAVSQGMCLADLDNDGDLDVVINNLNGPAAIYRNNSVAARVAVRLRGAGSNTRGIGAKIKVFGGAVPMQSQEMICAGRYLSCDDTLRVFAAGSLTNRMSIEVAWRSGQRTKVDGVTANRIYEIVEGVASGGVPSGGSRSNPPSLFADVSHLLKHSHRDELFDDFSLQPTLVRRLSQLGPGVSWVDINADGWDDLVIGSGAGGRVGVFRNDGHGGFVSIEEAPFHQLVTRDQTAILGWRGANEEMVLLAGSANYEDGLTNGSMVRQFHLASKSVVDALPGSVSSTGPLALADIDNDGQLDLFVGGRCLPGRYPEPASSMMFRGAGGRRSMDLENSRQLAGVGMVSGAVFTDLEGDGDPDLVLACEWGPVKVFRNSGGRLEAWDPPVRISARSHGPSAGAHGFGFEKLGQLTGWWNGVTAADFDGDGRLDLAASNWGQNSHYERYRNKPLRMFYGEFRSGGPIQAIEGYAEESSGRLLPLQPFHIMGVAMPSLRERLGTFEVYARSTLPEIYGADWQGMKELQAAWLESTVFLNRGDHFEIVVLPLEAQLAPSFAVCAADFDGDGAEDLFLSQNFFAVHPDTSRHDAGRGLLLRGDGAGGFNALSGQESGIKIYGEQRGAAACDYDGDGRADLVVAQNAADTKLWHNENARAGLRIRLAGPSGNRAGVGAVVRLLGGSAKGPAREIHSGSGYWSQDSAVQVMALAGTAAANQLEVRWPGGKSVRAEIPAGAREISMDVDGRLSVLR